MGATDQGIDAGRWMAIPRTLIFLTSGLDVLLMKRGAHKKAFPGRFNGIGGHVEHGEDPLTGARREIAEETGIEPAMIDDLRLRGIHHIDPGNAPGILLFVFSGESRTRAVWANDEGTLEWVPLAAARDLPLVDDVPILLDRLFGPDASQAVFFAHIGYDAQDRMVMRFG